MGKVGMYKIGEFSKITSLSVKTLHYYDEEGILSPSYRDEENGYRYYNEEDFKKAELISKLRALDFSIGELRDITSGYEEEDLSYFLREKRAILEDRIHKERAIIKALEKWEADKGLEEKDVRRVTYEMKIESIPCCKVISTRYKGKYQEVGKYIGPLYKAIGGKAIGVPFCCYYVSDYQEVADIELCIPIGQRTKVSLTKDQEVKELPCVMALTTIHKGSYEKLHLAYKALIDYAKKEGFECLVPLREIYHKGPGMFLKGNPNKYITKIIVPIKNIDKRK